MRHPRPMLLIACLALAASAGALARGAFARASARAPEPAAIAVVDALAIVEKLLDSDRYRPARDDMQARVRSELDELASRIQQLQSQAASLDQASPEFQQAADQFNQAQQRDAILRAGVDEHATSQAAEAYRLAIEIASVVAQRQGFTYVLASRTEPTLVRSKNLNTAIQEILARGVIVMPQGSDITDAVLAELKLPVRNASMLEPARTQTP